MWAQRHRVEVEYSLRNIIRPAGVRGYTLPAEPPRELAGKLPETREIEAEIFREMGT